MTDAPDPGKGQDPDIELALARLFSPIIHPELLWAPTFQERAPELDHLPFLYWIVAVLRPRRTVTLNIGAGAAHFAICQSASEYLTGAQCLGVAAQGTDLSDAFEHHSERVYPDLSSINGDVLHVIPDAHDIDLIVVETGLRQTLVADLIETWVPLLSDQGVLLLFGVDETDPECDPVLQQLIAMAHHRFLIPHGPGLLVLVFGSSPPPDILTLISLTSQAPLYERVTQLFERLGRVLGMALKTRTEPVSETSHLLGTHAGKLSAILSFAEDEAHHTDEALVAQAEPVEIEKSRRLLSKARAGLKNRDAKIATLSRQCEKLREELQLLQAENVNLNRALLQRNEDIDNMNAAQRAQHDQTANLHKELGQYKQAQIDILSSTSWRITRPIRYIGALLKRGK